jgi:hypothetical protein
MTVEGERHAIGHLEGGEDAPPGEQANLSGR